MRATAVSKLTALKRISSCACLAATASTASLTICERKVSAEELKTRITSAHSASSLARRSCSTCRRPLSSASRMRRVSSAWRTISAILRSSRKRTSSLARKSSVLLTSSACSASHEVATSVSLCSRSWRSASAACASSTSRPGASSARSSWMSSRRRSLPSNIMFCTARPRSRRCSSTVAFSRSSSTSGCSVCGVGGRSRGFTTR
mmetsp:Transcript_20390/g.60177  ORF Transcript_20390/g.60177 Transcript_20390/m.60177 type:complete len:205 (-) Transcript_20390:1137-1751(-)